MTVGKVISWNKVLRRGLAEDFLGYRYRINEHNINEEDIPHLLPGMRIVINTEGNAETCSVEIPDSSYRRYCEEQRELWEGRTRDIVNE